MKAYESLTSFESSLKEIQAEPALREFGKYHVVLRHESKVRRSTPYSVTLWLNDPCTAIDRKICKTMASAREAAAKFAEYALKHSEPS